MTNRRRPQKITLGEMRASGWRWILVFCGKYSQCGHYESINADRWPDDVRLSDLEPRVVCNKCGTKGADVRPDMTRP